MLSEEQVDSLANFGNRYTNRINEVLLEADDLRALPDKQFTLAVIVYAAALAKLTKLELDDFLILSSKIYQRVEVKKPPSA